ncbi:hypothetical protein POM88_045975 [Heracleum sosnowskyi]|uniref:RRM domain-containing protein n=1 Tax=Heracleum sosnowskyi TaxID=360622 RepID=A0AAD8M5H9_9APIA|nr:hypothetical protein POM88_045975 [Heracleum sosnowskyi]
MYGEVKADKLYIDAVKEDPQKDDVKSDGLGKWELVQRKRSNKRVFSEEHNTIFLYNIPDNATTQEVWSMFKGCGQIDDIVLPRKRDKRNNRYGFVKTRSEREAGVIISNVKEKGGLSAKIKMMINGKKESSKEKTQGERKWM